MNNILIRYSLNTCVTSPGGILESGFGGLGQLPPPPGGGCDMGRSGPIEGRLGKIFSRVFLGGGLGWRVNHPQGGGGGRVFDKKKWAGVF